MKDRIISPHLSIYKPQITSVLSIIHRITGVYMFFCLALIFFVLQYNIFINNTIFIITTIAFIISLAYHTCNGIRYMFWSCEIGLNIKSNTTSGYLIVSFAIALSTLSIYLFLHF